MQVRVTVLWSCQRIYTTLTPFSSTFSLPLLYPPLPSPFTRSTLTYPLHNSATSTSSPLYFLSTISYLLFILASTSPVLGSSSSYPPPPYTPSSPPTYTPNTFLPFRLSPFFPPLLLHASPDLPLFSRLSYTHFQACSVNKAGTSIPRAAYPPLPKPR